MEEGQICILCKKTCEEKAKVVRVEDWEKLKDIAYNWKSLDKYGDVYETVEWESGSADKFWHADCKRDICGTRKLDQARKRKRKSDDKAADICIEEPSKKSAPEASGRTTRKSVGIVHKKDLCIWCMKSDDTARHPDRGKFFKICEQKSWLKFKASVMYITDVQLKTRIQTFIEATTDPFSTEVWYHDSCRKRYIKPVYNTLYTSDEREDLQNVSEQEIEQNFINYISQTILDDEEPKTLKCLCKEYTDMLLNFGFFKTIKSDRMKDLLISHFGEKIGFHPQMQRNKSDIVYSTEKGKTYFEAIINGSEITDAELFLIAANKMREGIKSDKKNRMEWPPSVNKLCTEENSESTLSAFLRLLSNIKEDSEAYSKILFLSECIQSLVIKEKTRMKTVFSVTLHGLTRNREIVQMASDLGVGISYKSVLRLHDSWALQELKESEVCPAEIAEGKAGTVIIDNDDFKDDDLTGGTTSHRTNMMFVQPKKWISEGDFQEPSLKVNAREELKRIIPEEIKIQPYSTLKRGEPPPFKVIDTTPDTTETMKKMMVTHALVRLKTAGNDIVPEEQRVGAFTGFMSSVSPRQDQSKPYYFATLPKPPSKAVVYSLIEKAEAAARLMGMPFIQFVGDQPVYAHVVEIKYENPEKFSHILPVLGSFHTQMCFMKTIYKRIKESNIEDLLVESGLIVQGSVDKALSGGHYNRATRLYKLFYEAMIRIIITHGEKNNVTLPSTLDTFVNIICDTEMEADDRYFAFQTILEDAEFSEYVKTLFDLQGPDNHMANYIMSILGMIEILFMNIDSLRTKNWKRFLSSIRLMMPWMMVYDQTNYSRWLPVFWLEMSSLPEEHEELISEIFSQSLTGNSYSSQPPDLWIECTMNKGSKMKAGWKRLLKNEIGLHVHVKNANNISTVRHFLENRLDSIKAKSTHKENVKSRLRIDEQCVQDVISLISVWECDPFDLQHQLLRSFQAGAYASKELVEDFESAYCDGELLVQDSIKERLFTKSKSIFDQHSKNKRKTFATPRTDSHTNEKGNKEMEVKALIATLDLVTKTDPELLRKVFDHRITENCLSIFNSNGSIRKCQKSKLIQAMELKSVSIPNYISIVDMGLIWRLATPSTADRDKNDGTCYVWKDYADKVFNLLLSRHPNATTIIAVNDYYGSDVLNTKDGEHKNRSKAFSGGYAKNIFPSKDQRFPSKKEFSDFFHNPSNKIRLQDFLKGHFTSLCKTINKRFIYHERQKCADISSSLLKGPVHNLQCSHLEADTAMLFIYSSIRVLGDTSAVLIDAEDADVVVLAAYASSVIDGQLAVKRKKAIIDCKTLCSKEMAKIVVPLHVATGCDVVSSFFGIGKKTVWARVEKSAEARTLLSNLSQENLNKFVIKYIYNDKLSKSLGEMRCKKWKKMKSKKAKSLARVGPDEDSNSYRNKRVIYQSNILLNFQNPEAPPNPTNHGFTNTTGLCLPIMYTKPPLPDDLTIGMTSHNSTNNEDSDSDTDESIGSSDDDIDDGLDI